MGRKVIYSVSRWHRQRFERHYGELIDGNQKVWCLKNWKHEDAGEDAGETVSGEWIDEKMILTTGRETTWTRQHARIAMCMAIVLGGIVVLLVHFINHPSSKR